MNKNSKTININNPPNEFKKLSMNYAQNIRLDELECLDSKKNTYETPTWKSPNHYVYANLLKGSSRKYISNMQSKEKKKVEIVSFSLLKEKYKDDEIFSVNSSYIYKVLILLKNAFPANKDLNKTFLNENGSENIELLKSINENEHVKNLIENTDTYYTFLIDYLKQMYPTEPLLTDEYIIVNDVYPTLTKDDFDTNKYRIIQGLNPEKAYLSLKNIDRKKHIVFELSNSMDLLFSQNTEAKNMLQNIPQKYIIYNSEDTFLGINEGGNGYNVLGRLLMEKKLLFSKNSDKDSDDKLKNSYLIYKSYTIFEYVLKNGYEFSKYFDMSFSDIVFQNKYFVKFLDFDTFVTLYKNNKLPNVNLEETYPGSLLKFLYSINSKNYINKINSRKKKSIIDAYITNTLLQERLDVIQTLEKLNENPFSFVDIDPIILFNEEKQCIYNLENSKWVSMENHILEKYKENPQDPIFNRNNGIVSYELTDQIFDFECPYQNDVYMYYPTGNNTDILVVKKTDTYLDFIASLQNPSLEKNSLCMFSQKKHIYNSASNEMKLVFDTKVVNMKNFPPTKIYTLEISDYTYNSPLTSIEIENYKLFLNTLNAPKDRAIIGFQQSENWLTPAIYNLPNLYSFHTKMDKYIINEDSALSYKWVDQSYFIYNNLKFYSFYQYVYFKLLSNVSCIRNLDADAKYQFIKNKSYNTLVHTFNEYDKINTVNTKKHLIRKALEEKFKNIKMKNLLQKTSPSIILYNTTDPIFGIGNPKNKGKNIIGNIYTNIRDGIYSFFVQGNSILDTIEKSTVLKNWVCQKINVYIHNLRLLGNDVNVLKDIYKFCPFENTEYVPNFVSKLFIDTPEFDDSVQYVMWGSLILSLESFIQKNNLTTSASVISAIENINSINIHKYSLEKQMYNTIAKKYNSDNTKSVIQHASEIFNDSEITQKNIKKSVSLKLVSHETKEALEIEKIVNYLMLKTPELKLKNTIGYIKKKDHIKLLMCSSLINLYNIISKHITYDNSNQLNNINIILEKAMLILIGNSEYENNWPLFKKNYVDTSLFFIIYSDEQFNSYPTVPYAEFPYSECEVKPTVPLFFKPTNLNLIISFLFGLYIEKKIKPGYITKFA